MGTPGPLPKPWREMLNGGQIMTALLLCSSFSEKYKGRDMKLGALASIKLPTTLTEMRVTSPVLRWRVGSKETAVLIWVGDSSQGDKVVYAAFNPLRRKQQFLQLLAARGNLVDATFVQEGEGDERESYSVRLFSYIHKKLDNLWRKYKFEQVMLEVVEAYPSHKIVFCGLSHGAALAQAALFRLALVRPNIQVQAVTWNAYKWTDAKGVNLFDRKIGNRLLTFVLSRKQYWDSISGAPPGLASMNEIIFLDAETGETRPSLYVPDSKISPESVWRMYDLHFAKTALTATRLLMTTSLGQPSLLERMASMKWPIERRASLSILQLPFDQNHVLHALQEQEEEQKQLDLDSSERTEEMDSSDDGF